MFDVRSLFAVLRGSRLATTPLARGSAALERGEFAQALATFDAIASDASDDAARAMLENKRGCALVGLGDRAAAIDAFARALHCDERCAPALTNVGNLLFESGHARDAIDYYEAAIRADADYAFAHQNLGVALRAQGRHGEAVRALRTATRLAAKRRLARR